jgi:hypothetical protein
MSVQDASALTSPVESLESSLSAATRSYLAGPSESVIK